MWGVVVSSFWWWFISFNIRLKGKNEVLAAYAYNFDKFRLTLDGLIGRRDYAGMGGL
jgi:hypothetical protein